MSASRSRKSCNVSPAVFFYHHGYVGGELAYGDNYSRISEPLGDKPCQQATIHRFSRK